MTSALSARAPMAFRDAARSQFATVDAHQKGGAGSAFRRLPHGHAAHVGVHDEPQGSMVCMASAAIQSVWPLLHVRNWRGLNRLASFSRISHRLVALPPSRLVAERAFPAALAITIHHVQNGSRRPVVHSLPAKHVSQNVAYRLHLSSALPSCTVREVSCATNGLGNARKAFGEIRNV